VGLFRIPKGLKCVERREAGRGAGVHAPQAEFTFRTYCRHTDGRTVSKYRFSQLTPVDERRLIRTLGISNHIHPGRHPQLLLSPLWRTHNSHREINRRSDPTSLPAHGAYGRNMKPLSHFETLRAQPRYAHSSLAPRTTSRFPLFVMSNATTLHYFDRPKLNDAPAPDTRSPSPPRHIQFP
jgi:hypothetical protein